MRYSLQMLFTGDVIREISPFDKFVFNRNQCQMNILECNLLEDNFPRIHTALRSFSQFMKRNFILVRQTAPLKFNIPSVFILNLIETFCNTLTVSESVS